jgi:hypothetical protein
VLADISKTESLTTQEFRVATNAPSFVSNNQIHENLEVPFFTDHITALGVSNESQLTRGTSEMTHGWKRMTDGQ